MRGLGQADAGSVHMLGTSPEQAVARGLVGAVMQTGGLLKDLTVRETVEVIASSYGRPFAAAAARDGKTLTAQENRARPSSPATGPRGPLGSSRPRPAGAVWTRPR